MPEPTKPGIRRFRPPPLNDENYPREPTDEDIRHALDEAVGHVNVLPMHRRGCKDGAIGSIGPDGMRVARACFVCGCWVTVADRKLHEAGAEASHGVCPSCAPEWRAKMEAEMEALLGPDDGPEAA